MSTNIFNDSSDQLKCHNTWSFLGLLDVTPVCPNIKCKYGKILFFQTPLLKKLIWSAMATVEQPCYTLINFPSDSEPINEMQLKADLGKCNIFN